MAQPAAALPGTDSLVGATIVGRYVVLGRIGRGAMAEVYRALDQASGAHVAIKVLNDHEATRPETLQRFKREGEVLRALRHPSIVHVDNSYEVGGRVFLVMELLDGETLGARMARGRIDAAELLPIVRGVAEGLGAAHAKGVVHRDLKPDNVFIERAGTIKLLDFGVSKVFGSERLTATGQVLGTPRYMSPEQLGTEDEIDHRVDVYSLGVILFEALTGSPPYRGATPTELIVAVLRGGCPPASTLNPALSPALDAVIARAMARSRAERFESASALVAAYEGALEGALERPAAGHATQAFGGVQASPTSSMIIRSSARTMLHGSPDSVPAPAPPRSVPPTQLSEPLPAYSAPEVTPMPDVPTPPQEPRPAPHDGRPSPLGWASIVLTGLALAALSAWGVTRVMAGPIAPSTPSPTEPLPAEPQIALPTGLAPPTHAAVPEATPPLAVEVRAPSVHPEVSRRRAPSPSGQSQAALAATTPEPTVIGAPTFRVETPVAPEADDPLSRAARALREGRPDECLRHLEGSGLSPAVIRRRAECELGLGDTASAIADYQRFCRLVPDHPAIPEVRGALARLGATCP